MKKIGIIGGLAWPSTADYYRLICKLANEHFSQLGQSPPFATPQIVIESLNIFETRSARGVDGDEASWKNYDTIFQNAFNRLQQAGADFGLIASNTPHTRLHAISRGLELPVISILETTAKTVVSQGGKNALVLGTPLTMRSSMYPEVLAQHQVSALAQIEASEIEELNQLIDVDLYQGKIKDARKRILEISKKYTDNSTKDIVCLACTELPLAFPEHADAAYFEVENIGFVNTIAAHVNATVNESLSVKEQ